MVARWCRFGDAQKKQGTRAAQTKSSGSIFGASDGGRRKGRTQLARCWVLGDTNNNKRSGQSMGGFSGAMITKRRMKRRCICRRASRQTGRSRYPPLNSIAQAYILSTAAISSRHQHRAFCSSCMLHPKRAFRSGGLDFFPLLINVTTSGTSWPRQPTQILSRCAGLPSIGC